MRTLVTYCYSKKRIPKGEDIPTTCWQEVGTENTPAAGMRRLPATINRMCARTK